jgi:hypothetical protein
VPTFVTPPKCFTLASSFSELPVIYVRDGDSTKKLSYINAQLTQQMAQLDSVEVGDFFAVK